MKKSLTLVLASGVLLTWAACSSQEKPAEPPAAAGSVIRGVSAVASMSFSVEATDVPNRTITLKGPQGKVSTFKVGEEVKRFSEIKAGDSIVAKYHVGVAAELRAPTAEEKSSPVQVLQSTSRAPSDVPASVSLTRAAKVVTTVEAVDRSAQTVTLKGPQGNTVTFKVEDPSSLSDLKAGQTLIATFGERLVVTVEPGSKG
jgi:Cu/Ag efflux protein CusF